MLKNNSLLRQRKILKIIVNFWAILTMVLMTIDFFSNNQFNAGATAISIIYLGILGIYISEKEYSRWKAGSFRSMFLGETFVIVWTLLMLLFIALAFFQPYLYKVPSEFAIIYASVIAAFAISQQSKALKKK